MWCEQPIHQVDSYDVSDGDTNFDYESPNEPDLYFDASWQVVMDDIVGGADGTLVGYVSNDGVNWVEHGTFSKTIALGDSSTIWELTNLLFPHIRIAFTANSITTGSIDIYRVMKRKAKP